MALGKVDSAVLTFGCYSFAVVLAVVLAGSLDFDWLAVALGKVDSAVLTFGCYSFAVVLAVVLAGSLDFDWLAVALVRFQPKTLYRYLGYCL